MMIPRPALARGGFTLTELLVAIAVLALVVAAVGQIIATSSQLTTTSNKHIDADGQARLVFDRMANDFGRMVKRNDVDYIFCKAAGNDTLYFYSEGASYFNGSAFASQYKDSVSLVGYRVNNGSNGVATAGTLPYGAMERLGAALSWASDLATSGVKPWATYLTYPAAGSAPTGATYSSADYTSTLLGAYATASAGGTSLVGTLAKNFQDSKDTSYHILSPNVFRFEFTFQLKDGTQGTIPVMTPSSVNGIPSANLTATAPPTATTDSTLAASISNTSTKYAVGSRWYDTANQVGYICVDATPSYAVWHEIGIQDISAIVVNLAVIDNQGLVYIQKRSINPVTKLAAQFADGTNSSILNTWTAAVTPSGATPSAVATAAGMPQSMVSQIRIYQRFFYINNL